MTPTPKQLHAALMNFYKPLRTPQAKVYDALEHVRNSKKAKPGGNRTQLMFGDIDNTGALHELE